MNRPQESPSAGVFPLHAAHLPVMDGTTVVILTESNPPLISLENFE